MHMAGYCSHGDSREIRAPVTLKRLRLFLLLKRSVREANMLRCCLCYCVYQCNVGTEHEAGRENALAVSDVMYSMSRRGYFPHGGGVFQGMGGSCCARSVLSG